jgi:hypothetical protein
MEQIIQPTYYYVDDQGFKVYDIEMMAEEFNRSLDQLKNSKELAYSTGGDQS